MHVPCTTHLGGLSGLLKNFHCIHIYASRVPTPTAANSLISLDFFRHASFHAMFRVEISTVSTKFPGTIIATT